jgi:hypothetical protein
MARSDEGADLNRAQEQRFEYKLDITLAGLGLGYSSCGDRISGQNRDIERAIRSRIERKRPDGDSPHAPRLTTFQPVRPVLVTLIQVCALDESDFNIPSLLTAPAALLKRLPMRFTVYFTYYTVQN